MPLVNWNKWIQDNVKGGTFVDIGGLYQTLNEKVTVALKGGASSATMVDLAPVGHQMWQDFDRHCERQGISGYRCVISDATQDSLVDDIGVYDMVHCSGVIYHAPNPVNMLISLRKCTRKYLILVSMVVPEDIVTPSGEIHSEGGIVYFVPNLSPSQHKIFYDHFDSLNVKVHGITGPEIERWVIDQRPLYGPWWWLWTPSFLRGMVEACKFRVLDAGYIVPGRAYGYLCEKNFD